MAVGQTTAGGNPEIVTGPGPGPTSDGLVRIWTSTGALTRSFFAYTSFQGGVFVAVGDVIGNGRVGIVTGAGEGIYAHVRHFNGEGEAVGISFLAYPGPGGVRVAVGDVDGDGFLDIITGEGTGEGRVRVFQAGRSPAWREFDPFDSSFTGGVFVAGTSAASLPSGSSLLDDASDDDDLLTALATENRQAMSPDQLDRVLADGW